MLDPVLIGYEVVAVDALAGQADAVTRRALAYMPPTTPYYAVDITCAPDTAEGHAAAELEIEVETTIRVFGRGVDGTAVMDRARFLADLSHDTLLGLPGLQPLFAEVRHTSWARDVAIDDGATVYQEEVRLRSVLRHTVGAGQALGITQTLIGDFAHGRVRAELAQPVIYPASLTTVLVSLATITALYAGLPAGAVIELRDGAGLVLNSTPADAAAGQVLFPNIDEGDYSLAARDGLGAELTASPFIIRVRRAP